MSRVQRGASSPAFAPNCMAPAYRKKQQNHPDYFVIREVIRVKSPKSRESVKPTSGMFVLFCYTVPGIGSGYQ